MVAWMFDSFPAQPPSGGCELKPPECAATGACRRQPPSGGCELKPVRIGRTVCILIQPPSGGCELKPVAFVAVGYDVGTSRLRAAVS